MRIPTWIGCAFIFIVGIGGIVMGLSASSISGLTLGTMLIISSILFFAVSATLHGGGLENTLSVTVSNFPAWVWAVVGLMFALTMVMIVLENSGMIRL